MMPLKRCIATYLNDELICFPEQEWLWNSSQPLSDMAGDRCVWTPVVRNARGLGIQLNLLCRSEMFFQLLLTFYRLVWQGQAWEDYRPCQHVQISLSPLLASGVRPCYSQCPPPAYPCPPALSSKSSPRLLGPRSAHTWMNLSKEVQGPEETSNNVVEGC